MKDGYILNFPTTQSNEDNESFKDLENVENLWRFVGNAQENWFKLKEKEKKSGSNAISLFSSNNNFSYAQCSEAEAFISFVKKRIIPSTDEKYRNSRKPVSLVVRSLLKYLNSSDNNLREAVKSISISEKSQQKYLYDAVHWDFKYTNAEACESEDVKSILYACTNIENSI